MGEHKCVVSYCCCGCSLKSGSLAIGIVVLILSLLRAIYDVFLAVKYGEAINWVGFVAELFLAIMSCVLIQGIRQERRGFVMAWVITMVVVLVIESIVAIMVTVTISIPIGLVTLAVIGIYVYLVVVVRSYGLTIGSSGGVA